VPRRQFFEDPAAHGILCLYEANKIRIGQKDAKRSLAMDQEEAAIFEALLPPPAGSAAVTVLPNRSHARAGRLGILSLESLICSTHTVRGAKPLLAMPSQPSAQACSKTAVRPTMFSQLNE
jgi:hypothetical protein